MSDDFDDDDDLEVEEYELNSADLTVVKAAIQLLEKIVRAPFVTPAKTVSVSKALHVLKRLPSPSSEMTVSVTLTGPRRLFHGQGEEHEIYHWWEVEIEGTLITVSSRGHFYRQSTGGDAFIAMQWNAAPGCETDHGIYLDTLRIVDDAQPFHREVEQIDLSKPGYSISVSDDDNPLLEEMSDNEESESESEEEEEEEEANKESEAEPNSQEQSALPLTQAEQELMAAADVARGLEEGEFCLPPESCDFCGEDLSNHRLFVDGRLRGQIAWGNMCAECFTRNGEGIGWGRGQLYQRQSDGEWLMVAGFRPPD